MKRVTKYGDKQCRDFKECKKCPIRELSCYAVPHDNLDDPLYDVLEELKKEFKWRKNNPVYQYFLRRLNKTYKPE